MKRFFVTVFIFFIWIYPIRGYSFFQINKNSEEIRIDNTIIDASTQDNNTVYMYDNALSQNSESFLAKRKTGFIPMAEFKIEMPLRLLVQNSIAPDASIDRILMANLRANSFYLEYKKLQEKAKELLRQTSDFNAGKIKDTRRILEMKESDQVPDIDAEKIKIAARLKSIRQMDTLIMDVTSGTEIILPDGITSPHQLKENKDMEYRAGTSSYHSVEAAGYAAKQQYGGYQQKTQLPWVFRIIIKIWNYTLNNRVEIILYLMFIAIAGFFISLKVRQ